MKLLKYQFLLFVVILTAVIFNSACRTDPKVQPATYESLLETLHEEDMFNGTALVLKNGELAYQGAFGISNIDPVDSLQIGSIFRLASVSKQFTAMGIMLLKEEGKLSFDQNMQDFIPELPYENITIRHLMHHTSGMPSYENLLETNWKVDLKADDPARMISGNQDIIDMLVERKPAIHFEPGEKWEYSNTAYVLLASIVERVAGQSFESFLKERIFDPLEMNSTSVYKYVHGPDPNMPLRVYGYRLKFNGKDRVYNDANFLNMARGDGGMFSTVGDLLKWDRAMYTEKLISAATREEAYTSGVLNNGEATNYGFGVSLRESPTGKKTIEHGGGWVGFRTYIYREIEDNNCIIILTNHSSNYLGGVLNALKNILHGKAYEMPKKSIAERIASFLSDGGAESAIDQYKKLKDEEADSYQFGQYQLVGLGYELMKAGQLEDAIKILRFNAEEYLESAYTNDLLGDAFLQAGDTAQALASFKQAVAIDSSFVSSKAKIAKIENNVVSN